MRVSFSTRNAQPQTISSLMNILRKIFISPDEPRLRAGWRLALQTIWMIILVICVMLPIGFLNGGNLDGGGVIWMQILQLIAFTLSIFLARRFLDRRTFSSLGLKLDRFVMRDLLVGIGITFVMMGLIFWIELALGWLTIDALAWQVDPVSTVLGQTTLVFLGFVLVGWNEELLSRGYHLQTLISGTNVFWGVFLSSAVFGILHLGNPNAHWTAAVGILFAGIFLAYAYLRTRQLWLPIGLHIGWNFFEGAVFGFPVSGMDTYRLVHSSVAGPPAWTGGPFGPEAGLIMIPALVVGFGLIYAYSHNRQGDKDNI
jgi:uncharacterized protein